ncbi:MAG: glycosyltransferase [Ignavibacteriales bacterium]|nr:glycosyltransferase [Ignavibacteriales bacterium]
MLNWELVIVDDYSSDGSVDLISKYLTDSRIKLIKLNQNNGVAFAKVQGINSSQAPLFGTMGSDDALVENGEDTS